MSMNKKTRSLYGSREEAQRIYNQRQQIKTQQNIIDKLKQENSQLKERIENAIDFINIYTNGINLEAFDCLKLMYKIEEILKGDKEC